VKPLDNNITDVIITSVISREREVTQKVSFSRDAIVEAAVELTRENGWASVTARSIATRIGSSTMPIYSTTSSMREIEIEVRRAAEAKLLQYQRRVFTGDLAGDKAIGYVVFAREEKNLFRFLYVDRPTSGTPVSEADESGATNTTFEALTATDALPTLAKQAAVALHDPRILKSWIFTHGLAMLIGSGVIALSDERIAELLQEAGTALVGGVNAGQTTHVKGTH